MMVKHTIGTFVKNVKNEGLGYALREDWKETSGKTKTLLATGLCALVFGCSGNGEEKPYYIVLPETHYYGPNDSTYTSRVFVDLKQNTSNGAIDTYYVRIEDLEHSLTPEEVFGGSSSISNRKYFHPGEEVPEGLKNSQYLYDKVFGNN